jgi:hypothetical protein
MKYKMPVEKPFDSTLSIDSIASSSHDMLAHRTMFVKPSMSNHHTHSTCGDRGKSAKGTSYKNSNFIPTCNHCGIVVISALIAFRYVLRNFGINSMCLGKMNLVLRTKLRP